MTSDDHGSERVDGRLEDDRAGADKRTHERHGEPLLDEVDIDMGIGREMTTCRDEDRGGAENEDQTEERAYGLSENRSEGGPADTKTTETDEDNIESNVEKRGDDEKNERHERVADGAEEAGEQIIGEKDGAENGDKVDVGERVADDGLRSAEQPEEVVEEETAGDRDENRDNGGDDERSGDSALESVEVIGTESAGHDDAETIAEAETETDHEFEDGDTGTDCSERVLAEKVTDNDGVGSIVELLKETGDDDGEREREKSGENGSASQF